MNLKLSVTIFITLLFFATNSLLARAALVSSSIDAFSFTFFRLFSGAVVLLILVYFKEKEISLHVKKNWLSSFMLFLYALAFSYSYINLNAGIGALILFAVVQLTLIVFALIYKEKINIQKIAGLLIALAGLIYLLYPKQSFEISLFHAFLMMLSGFAWGVYTILGKNSQNATLNTGDNFLKSLVYLIIFYFLFAHDAHISSQGLLLAIISGGVTSGLGYSIWYYVLPKISIMTSGVVQLLVPPIAILMSIFLLGEPLSLTLLLATIVILSGIFISIYKFRA